MVKLTPQIIDDAPERTNPIRERELILRGIKFSVIENLGIGLDAYDSYDLCDNDIQKLGNFPNLVKCRQIYANNNRINYLASDIHVKLPNLEEISLINNEIRSLTNLKRLEKCMVLKYLHLVRNPITRDPNYRKYAIYAIKSLKFLDYNRIKDKERAEAKKFFEQSTEGKKLLAQIAAKAKDEAEDTMYGEDDDDECTTATGMSATGVVHSDKNTDVPMPGPNDQVNQALKQIDDQQRAKIKRAILAANSVEEIERLNRMLQAGYIPSDADLAHNIGV